MGDLLSLGGCEVNIALNLITFLFIGGASSTAQLLSCQSTDGGTQLFLVVPFKLRQSFYDL